MNWKRYLKGSLHINYCHWQKWYHLNFHTKWSGRLIYFEFSKFAIYLDCRENWINDMITGKAA
jgi:hypothetical protein